MLFPVHGRTGRALTLVTGKVLFHSRPSSHRNSTAQYPAKLGHRTGSEGCFPPSSAQTRICPQQITRQDRSRNGGWMGQSQVDTWEMRAVSTSPSSVCESVEGPQREVHQLVWPLHSSDQAAPGWGSATPVECRSWKVLFSEGREGARSWGSPLEVCVTWFLRGVTSGCDLWLIFLSI